MSGPVVVYWDGRQPMLPGRLDRRWPRGARSGNFGDLLGPLVVAGLAGVPLRTARTDQPVDGPRLITVGSILHFARDGDVVWGSGVNGKVPRSDHRFRQLDVRAVRGPLTRRALQGMGVDVPEVFGDPGLLVPVVLPELVALARTKVREVTVLPHMSEIRRHRADRRLLSPRSPLREVLVGIAQSERVVTSSLHGVVVAESLGVPVQLVGPRGESPFKYEDYFAGTSRVLPTVYPDVESALRDPAPATAPIPPPPGLVSAFPLELFAEVAR